MAFKLIEKLINEHGSSVILKERLVQVGEQMEQLEQEKNRLQEENQKLIEKCNELTKNLESKTIPDDFIQYRGGLIRRDADGNCEPDIYCSDCKIPLTSLGNALPFRCSKCHTSLAFTGSDFDPSSI